MKRLAFFSLAAALLCGCATSRTEGSDGAEFTALWPLCQIDSKNDANWIFPVAWSRTGRFSVFPVLWWTQNWFVLGPFATATEKSIGTLFPLIYWNSEAGDEHLWTLAGLWGYWRDYRKPAAHWLLPFYAKTDDGVFTIPFSRIDRKTRFSDYYLCGLGGYGSVSGRYRSSWLLPFYYHDQDGLYTPLYGNTDEASWLTPFYYRSGTGFHTLLYSSTDTAWWMLFGLAGGRSNAARSWREDWAFPLYRLRDEVRFDEYAAKMEADQLTDALTEKELEVGFSSSRHKSFLLLFFSDEDVSGRPSRRATGTYSMTALSKIGLFPLWSRETEHRVDFDLATGGRKDDVEETVHRILFIPVWW